MARAGRGVIAAIRSAVVSFGYFRGPKLMSELRKRWVLIRNPHATIVFGPHCYLGPGFSIHVPYGGTFLAGRGVEFRQGFRAELGAGAAIEIGDETRFTYGVILQSGHRIDIGARCLFAEGSSVFDGDHRFRELDLPVLEQGYDLRDVAIANDVSIMAKCTVLASIGARSFVGAGAVVTREIPDHVVAVGVPARPIDYFGSDPERSGSASRSETSG